MKKGQSSGFFHGVSFVLSFSACLFFFLSTFLEFPTKPRNSLQLFSLSFLSVLIHSLFPTSSALLHFSQRAFSVRRSATLFAVGGPHRHGSARFGRPVVLHCPNQSASKFEVFEGPALVFLKTVGVSGCYNKMNSRSFHGPERTAVNS